MPATPAMTVHSHRSIDADTGQKDSLDGLLVDTVSIKVDSNRVDYRGGKNQKQVLILNGKSLMLNVKAKVLERAGVFSHQHPGTGIHRSYVTEFHPGIGLGFDTDTSADSYFIYLPTDSSPQKGEYDDHTFDLELWEDAADEIDEPDEPEYP